MTYAELRERAVRARHTKMRLEAELGLARCVGYRGDLPRAETMMLDLSKAAKRAKALDIYGSALTDLTWIAGARRRPYEALRYGHEALFCIGGHILCDDVQMRVLSNIAQALRELASLGVAARVAEHVLANAPSDEVRANACILLYNIAIDERDETASRSRQDRLSKFRLTPWLAAEYYEALAREHATFDRFADAEREIARMVAVAEAHKLAELVIRGDRALADIRKGRVPTIYEFRPVVVRKRAAENIRRMECNLLELCPT